MAGVPIADIGTYLRDANKQEHYDTNENFPGNDGVNDLCAAFMRTENGAYLVGCRIWFEGNGCEGICALGGVHGQLYVRQTSVHQQK